MARDVAIGPGLGVDKGSPNDAGRYPLGGRFLGLELRQFLFVLPLIERGKDGSVAAGAGRLLGMAEADVFAFEAVLR